MGYWRKLKTSGMGFIELEREAGSGWKALKGESIDVGASCINRSTQMAADGRTALYRTNYANETGYITNVCLYANTAGNVKVGIFYLVSGTTYKCRSASASLALSVGTNNKVVNLFVHKDDLIGLYEYPTGGAKVDHDSGASMGWVVTEDVCVVDAEAEFSNYDYYGSVYGTGEA